MARDPAPGLVHSYKPGGGGAPCAPAGTWSRTVGNDGLVRPVYEPGGVEMRPEARYALERVKAVLEEFPTLAVIVVGHVDADEASSKDAQIALSRGRAASARAQLLALGVAPHRVVIDGVGASRPRDVSRSAEARARNRRVEFELRPTAGKRITP